MFGRRTICVTATIDLDKVLVDTSVWIAFFRKSDPSYSSLKNLLAEDRVCIVGLILAELMQGAKSHKELDVLGEFVQAFECLPDTPTFWKEAGKLSFCLRKSGRTVGLADCYLAIVARECGVAIFSLDKHFSLLEKESKVKLFR